MNVAQLVQTAMKSVPADLKAAVVFTKETPGVYDPATGLFAGRSTSSVAGTASQGLGSVNRYSALGLVPEKSTTLIFVPSTAGDLPELDSVCTWAGVTQTVKSAIPIAPAGASFAAEVIVVAS